MEGIFSFLKNLVFYVSIFLFGTGLYLGYNAGSYITFNNLYKNKQALTPELKFSYRSNIIYKLHRWVAPEEFKDVFDLEANALQENIEEQKQDLYWKQHPEEYSKKIIQESNAKAEKELQKERIRLEKKFN